MHTVESSILALPFCDNSVTSAMLIHGVAFTGYGRYCMLRKIETDFMPRGELTDQTIKAKFNDERNRKMVSTVIENLGKMLGVGLIIHLE